MPNDILNQLMDEALEGKIPQDYIFDHPNYPGLKGATALHIAAGMGRIDVVRKILKDSPNTVNNTMSLALGQTPLHLALRNKQYDVAVTLLEYGADPTCKMTNGNTPLHYAIQCEMKLDQHLKIIQLLLKKGADPLEKNEKGNTPLHFAVSVTHTEVMDLLLQQPLPLGLNHLENKNRDTPLSLAVKANDQNMQDKLLTFGMTMNENDVAAKKELEKQQAYDIDLSADQMIVVNLFDDERVVNWFTQRWYMNHHGQSFLVSKESLLKDEKKISQTSNCSGRIKIYVLGHHRVGDDDIMGIKHQELAARLNSLIGDYDASNVVINLFSCEAARGQYGNPLYDSGKNSFAAKLQHDLVTQHDKNIPVIARTEVVSASKLGAVSGLGLKTTNPSGAIIEDNVHVFDYIHRQPRVKMVFHGKQKEQIKVDAYSARWKRRMLKLLNYMHKKTQIPTKKELLNEWLNGSKPFKDLSSDEIFNRLEEALRVDSEDRKTLEVHTHSLFGFAYASSKTSIDNIIVLMDERKNAIKHSVKTGLKAQDKEFPPSSAGKNELKK